MVTRFSIYVAARKDACLRVAACYLLVIIRRHRVIYLLATIFFFHGNTWLFTTAFSQALGVSARKTALLPLVLSFDERVARSACGSNWTQPRGKCHVHWHWIYPFRLNGGGRTSAAPPENWAEGSYGTGRSSMPHLRPCLTA